MNQLEAQRRARLRTALIAVLIVVPVVLVYLIWALFTPARYVTLQ